MGLCCKVFAALGHSSVPNLLADPIITAIAQRVGKTPAQVVLAWAIQRGTALFDDEQDPEPARGKLRTSAPLPEEAMREINEGIQTRIRLNSVVETRVPGVHSQRKVKPGGGA